MVYHPMITVSILDRDFPWNTPSSYAGTSIYGTPPFDHPCATCGSPIPIPGIIETVASVSALTFVDLDLDPVELGGRDGPGGPGEPGGPGGPGAEKQLASSQILGIFNDTHVINVIYIIYIELEQFHQCSSYTTRWRETETSTRTIIIWLVVSNMFYSSIYWE